jgi:TolB protein
MAQEEKWPLKVFLCHASVDKLPVRDLYKRLVAEGVDAWLDKEKLLPGQDWRLEIPRAVKEADVVVVCLSNKSVTKEGYVQKEIRFALDIAEEKPEGAIFLIPARLEDCVVPERLGRWQWVDLYEENGFIQLLRSLKLRADAMGATIEPASYEDSDKEIERRLEQLYTEGLAAFYTEDWDRACQRFRTILSERPSHRSAAEKLAEAERQRNLAKLYAQSEEAVRSEDWQTAIQTLEELSQNSADYKDTAQLLRNARKQKRLRDLYAEAKALHIAQKWQAVVKVFEQIAAIEPNYSDPDGLLSSAKKEVAELQRIAELNDQYSHALREMDAGNWIEARRLLEQVHKSRIGFLETEALLRKVEDEITKVDEQNKRYEQANILYEQAHGFVRSQKWRKALDKIEEIGKLDDHFEDKDGIVQKTRAELEREEQESQKQNRLAAMYAEAVKLLKEEKCQEALDKWQEIKTIDPKYPDRQWVQSAAKKALARQAKPISSKVQVTKIKSFWVGLGSVAIIMIVIFARSYSEISKENVLNDPVSTATKTHTLIPVIPTPTKLLMEEHIVYSGNIDGLGDQIFLMDPDGGNIEQLTFDSGQVRRRPSISPNGDKIAFSSGEWGNMNIYLVNPDGSDLTNLTDLRGDENEAKWSPDGKTIVFSSTRDGNREIYSINVDKTGFTRLTNNSADDGSPYWNLDGKTIVFSSDRGGDFDIYTMNLDGSELKRLTINDSNDSQPSWSPNGDYIAFMSDRDGNNEIYIMKSDGSNQTNMTNHPSNDLYPNWAPDGRHLVFFSDRDGDLGVYSMDLSSSIVKNLTIRLTSGASPFWGLIKP